MTLPLDDGDVACRNGPDRRATFQRSARLCVKHLLTENMHPVTVGRLTRTTLPYGHDRVVGLVLLVRCDDVPIYNDILLRSGFEDPDNAVDCAGLLLYRYRPHVPHPDPR